MRFCLRKKLLSVSLSTGIALGTTTVGGFITQIRCKAVEVNKVHKFVEVVKQQNFYIKLKKWRDKVQNLRTRSRKAIKFITIDSKIELEILQLQPASEEVVSQIDDLEKRIRNSIDILNNANAERIKLLEHMNENVELLKAKPHKVN